MTTQRIVPRSAMNLLLFMFFQFFSLFLFVIVINNFFITDKMLKDRHTVLTQQTEPFKQTQKKTLSHTHTQQEKEEEKIYNL